MFRYILFLSVSLIASGCVYPPPISVDLSEMFYDTVTIDEPTDNEISKLIIKNTARVSKKIHIPINPLQSINHPIHLHPPTPRTVENDIRRYFEQRLDYSSDSKRIIIVQLKKADAYFVEDRGVEALVPIFGILIASGKRNFVMDLNLTVRVEEHGKQVAAYVHDELIIIPGKIQNNYIVTFYKQLIAAYRNKLFRELDEHIFNQYFLATNG